MLSKASVIATLATAVAGQLVGTLTAEKHPALPMQECDKSGCKDVATSITLDANWRWIHSAEGSQNCYTGQKWDESICTDGKTCAAKCALEGADYNANYGITVDGSALKLNFITGTNVGSRVYLMASDEKYQMFKLVGKEFTFDVDLSTLPCGLNGALYLVEMPEDGGMADFPTNKAGAKYGTGYCDTQCPRDVKFINGEANSAGWKGSDSDQNSGKGNYGSCCHEMDIWEANSMAAAYTPHVCKKEGLVRCEGAEECGEGDNRYNAPCDRDGCDFNSYRMGNETFYGKSMTVDTSKPFTVVTQFIESGGKLSEIRRKYVQNGKVFENSKTNVEGMKEHDSVTQDFCTEQKSVFKNKDSFGEQGGLTGMGGALDRGMVLALSVWDDHDVSMLWLDSTYPTDGSGPGVKRGACATTSGNPKDVESSARDAYVVYSNIKVGDIDTTYKAA